MKGSTAVGLALLVAVIVLVLATQGPHDGHGGDVKVSVATTTPTPTPHPLATVDPPTPTPEADPFAPARWAAANVAVIFLMLAIGVGIPVGIALHGWHRSKLPTEDWRVPYRAPQFPAALDAHVRTSFPPVPQTYSPSLHIRNDQVPELEQPPQLAGPLPSAEPLVAMPGLAYGVRVDNGQPLVDSEIRSLLVGGQMGAGKSTLVALLGAQLYQMGARLVVGDPHASNPQGLSARMRTLIDRFELEQEPR